MMTLKKFSCLKRILSGVVYSDINNLSAIIILYLFEKPQHPDQFVNHTRVLKSKNSKNIYRNVPFINIRELISGFHIISKGILESLDSNFLFI